LVRKATKCLTNGSQDPKFPESPALSDTKLFILYSCRGLDKDCLLEVFKKIQKVF